MSKTPHYNNLSHKHQLFVDEYIANFGNATEAYIKAGYSKKTARFNASKLMRENEDIRKAIAERLEPNQLKRDLKIKRATEELEKMAFNEPKLTMTDGASYAETPPHSVQLRAIEFLIEHYDEPKKYKNRLRELEIESKEAEIAIKKAQADRLGGTDDLNIQFEDDVTGLIMSFTGGDEDE